MQTATYILIHPPLACLCICPIGRVSPSSMLLPLFLTNQLFQHLNSHLHASFPNQQTTKYLLSCCPFACLCHIFDRFAIAEQLRQDKQSGIKYHFAYPALAALPHELINTCGNHKQPSTSDIITLSSTTPPQHSTIICTRKYSKVLAVLPYGGLDLFNLLHLCLQWRPASRCILNACAFSFVAICGLHHISSHICLFACYLLLCMPFA